MSWNYRVIKSAEGYSIYEVFYDDNGNPDACTQEPIVDFYCETPEAIQFELDIIKKAFDKPVLNIEDFGEESSPPQ